MEFTKALHHIETFLNRHSPVLSQGSGLTPAAILIPIFEKDNQAHLLLTRRSDTVEHHKGQISFPGGSREPQDQDLLQTALRETEEEVGISEHAISPVGRLDDFPTISHFMVSPYIGTFSYPHPYQLNEGEVAEVLEVPLSLFLTDRYFEQRPYQHQGRTHPVYFYTFGQHTIWGVTGHIIHRMVEQIFSYRPDQIPL